MGRRRTGPPKKRCKAKSKQTGNPCKQWARPGYDVCVFHGAGKPGKRPGAPIKHGGRSMRFKRLAQQGADRISELTADAELGDVTRTVAASQYLIESAAVIDPDEELLTDFVKRMALEGGGEPTEADRVRARAELARYSQSMLDRHARLQQALRRQQVEADLVLEAALPIMRNFVERLMAIIDDEAEPKMAARIRKRFGQAQLAAVGELSEAGE